MFIVIRVKVEVTLQLTVSQSVNMTRCRAHSGTCDQILLPVGMFLSEICGLVSVGRPLWREDGSAVCSVITQWSESRRSRNHTLRLKLLYDWRSVSQSVCLGIEHPCGTCDQILLPVGMLLSEICGLISVGRPLWREVGSVSFQSLSAIVKSKSLYNWR
jgi:hypothetical protein